MIALILGYEMKRNTSIQLKAALLLIIFSLNTVIGFACAMGVDMGFNTSHDDDDDAIATTVRVHAGGTKHHHDTQANSHHHDQKEEAEKDGCCHDKAVYFQQSDKNLTKITSLAIHIPVFIALLSRFPGSEIFKPLKVSSQKYILQFFHPPPPDIGLLIRSFQI